MKKIILAAAVVITSSAMALTLKEQKQFKQWQAYLTDASQSYVQSVQEKCGYAIPLTMEDKFVTPFMTENANAASYCDSTRSTISSMCDDATSKAAIKKNIKKINCKLGKKEEASYKLAGGTLTFTVGVGASNLENKAKEFLENNLK
jgi:hypothetical protein